MHGIKLESGTNDCYWNLEGKCTCKAITRITTTTSRDWDSKINCTVTQLGVHLCSEYKSQGKTE
jgi:hypothetical protein